MSKVRVLTLVCLGIGGIVLTGCGGAGGLLSSAGFGSAVEVSFVLLDDYAVRDAATIRQLYDAVNKPERNWISRLARDRPMAFVARDGKVAYVMHSDIGDLTVRQGSDRLMRILDRVFHTAACKDTTHIPLGTLSEVRLRLGKGVTITLSPAAGGKWNKAHRPLLELLRVWNPNSLTGSKRCNTHEINRLSARAKRYCELRFARPAAFRTLIVPKDFEQGLPPETVDTRARLEEVRYDTVRLMNTRPDRVQLAFGKQGEDTWVLTGSELLTKRYLGRSRKGVFRLGPDLFEAALSAATEQ